MDDIQKIKVTLEDHEKRINELTRMLKKKETQIMKNKRKSSGATSLIEGLKDDGFFNVPRTLKEIKNELARNNFHYEVTSLTNPLQRLVRQRMLGRILQNGKWAYVKR